MSKMSRREMMAALASAAGLAVLGRQSKASKHEPGVAHAKPKYDRGDRVKVRNGTFVGMEGEVNDLLEAKKLVRVELTIFGRPVPVELEYWQVEHV